MKIRPVLFINLIVAFTLSTCSDDYDEVIERKVMLELNALSLVYRQYVQTGGEITDGDHDISFLQNPYGKNMKPILISQKITNPQGGVYRINITKHSVKYYTKITLRNGEIKNYILVKPMTDASSDK